MAPRKGNMMTVRNDVKVLDATIRDGGLCNNFEFTDEFVTELYKTNIKSGVDYMEFGYRASKKMFDPNEFGKWKFCDEEDIRKIVGDNISDMKIPVITNVTGTVVENKADIIPILIKQVMSPVKWEDTINYLASQGVDTFIEIGPGKTLSGFVKRTVKGVKIYNVEDMKSLEKTLKGLEEA